jgi:hypothetical protein
MWTFLDFALYSDPDDRSESVAQVPFPATDLANSPAFDASDAESVPRNPCARQTGREIPRVELRPVNEVPLRNGLEIEAGG